MITYLGAETLKILDTENGIDIIIEESGTGDFEDKITMGMRVGTQQADVFMGGFG